MNDQIYIIAEAGVNHNGSILLAKQLIDTAKHAGANAVKFQTYKTENLVTKEAQQADYQVDNIGEKTSQFEMLKSLELTYDEFRELKEYCDQKSITFLSTPFDFESVDFLLDEMDMQQVKIPSGELTNSPLLHYIATKRRSIILSTGMATLSQIHEALSFIAYGLALPNHNVEVEAVKEFYSTESAKEVLKKYVTVLHCTTVYPAPPESVNLRAMNQMRKELHLPIGFSDHTTGISIPIAAVSIGAVVIEKHFTLDRKLPGPDHAASLEPSELGKMVSEIRRVEKAMGNGMKEPSSIELANQHAVRKSLVATTTITEGELFTHSNITIKRPGNGMSPNSYWLLLGRPANKSYEKDDLLDE
ncbi:MULTISPECIES: N-acetylneuraminate synthase [Sporosarcina]|uniref:N-acetylneuraminate synthase n=1 Tax=Sporosarcina newyorkensis TaxID=759851 RepID=A0A1T4Y227_9BACL|nr:MULTISPECIES: N-acetylneuraminate synthase [Sporosarcina]MBY0223490.1 N-acetylneuraminate synthase [Sporosarcina aquimarina]SKA95683.1 N-acetylneuraminate synthase [Sporosarcina newyorkensis]